HWVYCRGLRGGCLHGKVECLAIGRPGGISKRLILTVGGKLAHARAVGADAPDFCVRELFLSSARGISECDGLAVGRPGGLFRQLIIRREEGEPLLALEVRRKEPK